MAGLRSFAPCRSPLRCHETSVLVCNAHISRTLCEHEATFVRSAFFCFWDSLCWKKNCHCLRDEAQPRRRDVTAWNESPRVSGMRISIGQVSIGAAAIVGRVCEQTGFAYGSAGTQQVAEGGGAVVVDRTLSCPYRYSSSSILVCFIIMSAAFFPSMKLSGRCPQARIPYL